MNRGVAVLGLAALAALYLAGRTKMGNMIAFIRETLNGARIAAKQFNLPAWLFLTAGAHESGLGISGLAREANNFFGFTADDPNGSWRKAGKPTVQKLTHEWVKTPVQTDVVKSGPNAQGLYYVARVRYFRKYATPAESFMDYGRLLTSYPRYAAAVTAARAGDPMGTFKALGGSGYATDPEYGTKLARVYQSVASNLKAVA